MDKNEIIAQTIKDFRKRADMSMAAAAKAIGLRGPSSWQRYEKPEMLPNEYFARDLVVKLEKAFAGKGEPPITKEEVWALAGPEFAQVMRPSAEGDDQPSDEGTVVAKAKRPIPNASFPPKYQTFDGDGYVPLLGQTIGGPNGRFILNGAEVGRLFVPPMLEGVEGAYGVRVYGTSMEPRYVAGETVWLNPHEPVRQGDDVVVQIVTEEENAHESYIKKFISKSARVTRLWQHNPDEGEQNEIEFDTGRVFSIHKIVFHATV